MIYGLRKYFLAEGNTPKLPKVFASDHIGMDPLDILAFYIIDEDFLHPLLLQATAFEYQVRGARHGSLGIPAPSIPVELTTTFKCPLDR